MKTKFTDPKGTNPKPSKRRVIPSKIDYGVHAITEAVSDKMFNEKKTGRTRFYG